jgi:1A family penicillin-binding protein
MKKRRDPRRSYGYVDTDRNTSPKMPEGKKRSVEKPGTRVQPPTQWSRILLFPFRIFWLILRYFFLLLGWIWKKIARISKEKGVGLGKKIFSIGLIAGVVLLIAGIGYAAVVSRDLPDPDRLTDRKVAESTKIYDRTGETLLYEIFADEKRTIVELEEIPDLLIKGVIATEDTKFYEHKGIRPLSILRAVVYGVFTNKRISGTSTLTQQLVKNAILTDERKITRKIKEAVLSIQLERKYSKDQILKIYFNEIPYGSTNYGIEAAAQSYFGKHVSDLDLQEIATLAGLPKAPSTYLRDKDALKVRRNFVLRRMFEEGYISEAEKTAAQSEPVTLERHFSDIRAPHFVLYVREQLVEQYGEQVVDTGGLNVITSLDWEKQQIAERAVEGADETLANADADNASLLAIDPKTGHILAMVGSREFENEDIGGQFNVATLGKRQPGSSFKPIIYTAAFEKGYTPETVLFDVVTNFAASGRPYTPLNYDLSEHGPVSMRQALQGSLNIPAVKTLYLVGLKQGIGFAERLGYTTLSDGNFGLTLVLGGGEVKLIDHVSAYGVFANNGVRHTPVSILKIEDSRGDVLQEWKQEKGERVLDGSVAATISNVLSDDGARAYAFGSGSILTLPGRSVAAKTGTTNNYIDAWTIGYTPSIVAGVWAGNTDNTPMKRGFGGSRVAGPIWNQFMREALEGVPAEGFPAPPANNAEKAALRGSQGGGITLSIDKVTGKLATSSTPEKYIVERTYIQPHSILHYVLKDDPRGDYPEDPGGDPQYAGWEAGIQDWIKRKKEKDPEWDVSFEEPPTDYDDAHALELIPTLTIVYPSPSSTLSSRQIDTDIRVTAKRGITKVTYKIDEKYVGVVREHPFNLNYYASTLDPGTHTLTIIAEDDVGNIIEEVVPFLFEGNQVEPSVSWLGENESTQQGVETTLFLNHIKLDQIKEVRVSQEKDGVREQVASISDFSNLFNNQILTTWTPPSSGNWQLIAEVVLNTGEQKETDRIAVAVQ